MSSERALNAFLQQYLKDQVAGMRRPLEGYQALFPGHEALVARHLAELEAREDAPAPAREPLRPPAGVSDPAVLSPHAVSVRPRARAARLGAATRRMAVRWTRREPSLGRHVRRELMRNALLGFTPIILATACYQRNYVATYSRSKFHHF